MLGAPFIERGKLLFADDQLNANVSTHDRLLG